MIFYFIKQFKLLRELRGSDYDMTCPIIQCHYIIVGKSKDLFKPLLKFSDIIQPIKLFTRFVYDEMSLCVVFLEKLIKIYSS